MGILSRRRDDPARRPGESSQSWQRRLEKIHARQEKELRKMQKELDALARKDRLGR